MDRRGPALVVAPLKDEAETVCHRLAERGFLWNPAQVGALPCSVVGPIASGDEDIVDTIPRAQLYAETEALCVAWEGSGAARAARFNGVGFVEIRVVTDAADEAAAASFHANLDRVMPHIADLLAAWRSALRERGEPLGL